MPQNKKRKGKRVKKQPTQDVIMLKKLKRNYGWWAFSAMLVQYGIPLSYIVYAYDIFEFEQAGQSITGWGIVSIAIVLTLMKNKIQDFVVDYNKHLNKTAQRGKWGFIFLIIGLFLMLAQYWLQSTLIFFLVLGGSNLLSLALYAPYDKNKTEYLELKDIIIQKAREEKIKGLSV